MTKLESSDSVDAVAMVLEAQQSGDPERLAEALLTYIETADDLERRKDSLVELTRLFEVDLADPARALPVAVAALAADPSDATIVDSAVRLALACGDTDDLYRELSAAAHGAGDARLGADLAVRLGNLYARDRSLFDYADGAYRQALVRLPGYEPALSALIELCRRGERWAELGELLEVRIPTLADTAEQAGEWLALGDIYEAQLAAPIKAEAAFDKATSAPELRDDALIALARLYRGREQWSKLAEVLDRRAQSGIDPAQAAQLYREAASVRSEKLGDGKAAELALETAIALQPNDLTLLQALLELCDRNGSTEKYFSTLEQLARRAPAKDKSALLRRLAMELENEAGSEDRAHAFYRELIEVDRNSPGSEDAYRAIARLHRAAKNSTELEKILVAHAAIAAGSNRATLWAEIAELRAGSGDANGAFFGYEQALLSSDPNADWYKGQAEVAEQIGRWDRAKEAWTRYAELKADAQAWSRAADLAIEHLGQTAEAEVAYQQARHLEPHNERACAGLAEVALRRHAWSDAVAYLIEAARITDSQKLRTGFLTQAAVLSETELAVPERAVELWLKVVELDPGQTRARAQAVAYLVRTESWEQALPHLARLAETSAEHGAERAQLELSWGRALAALGDDRAALEHFHRAADSDSATAQGWLEWTRMLEKLGDVEQLCDATGLALKAAELSTPERTTLLLRRARAERAHGELKNALTSFEQVLALAPGPEIAAERLGVMVELADAEVESQPRQAAALYALALGEDPDSLPVLHKMLELETRTERWAEATRILEHIANLTDSPERKAKYLSAAAVIFRDELRNQQRATAMFLEAAALAPADRSLLAATETMLMSAEAWPELAQLYRSALKAQGEDAPQALQLELWTKLGDLCLHQLEQTEAAITAYEVVTSLNPDDLERREELAELYLQEGDSRRGDAVEEIQYLLERQPERIELYRMLADLHRAESNLDGAYVTAQALTFLGVAEAEDAELFQAARPNALKPGRSRLGAERWQKHVPHSGEDRRLVMAFSRIMQYLAPAVAQPLAAFGVKSEQRVDIASDHRAVARVMQYAVDLLGIEPVPAMYIDEDEGGGIRIANVLDNGRLAPAILVGLPHALEQDERILAFELGRALSYLRPERYLFAAFSTLPALKTVVESVAGGGKWTSLIEKHLGASGLAEINQLLDDDEPLLSRIASFRDAADHTANRVGLLLAADLEIAATALAQASTAMTTLSVRDRLRELLSFSVSDGYLDLRRHVGLALTESGVAATQMAPLASGRTP